MRKTRSRVLPTETSAAVAAAASERIEDAKCCYRGRRHTAALYLSGSAVEMLLKTASWEVAKADPQRAPRMAYRACVPGVRQRPLGVAEDWDAGHSAAFWIKYLAAYRRIVASRGGLLRPWAARFERQVEARALWMRQHWAVTMRYSTVSVSRTEALHAIRCAVWLRRRHHQLGS